MIGRWMCEGWKDLRSNFDCNLGFRTDLINTMSRSAGAASSQWSLSNLLLFIEIRTSISTWGEHEFPSTWLWMWHERCKNNENILIYSLSTCHVTMASAMMGYQSLYFSWLFPILTSQTRGQQVRVPVVERRMCEEEERIENTFED